MISSIYKLGNNTYKISFFQKICKSKIGDVFLYHTNNIGYINNIFVDLEKQRKGYGSKMLNEVEKYLSNSYNINTYRILAWHQRNRKNASLHKFYYKNGYKKEFDSKNEIETIYDDEYNKFDMIQLIKKIHI